MFVVHYLEEKRVFCTIINYVGRLFFIFQVSTVGANCFVPIVFSVDSAGIYHPHVVRYALFLLQILILFITSVYTLIIAIKSHGSIKRRHLTIGLFGLAMILAITAQLFYTFWPLYSIGYLVGCCVLHTFVIEDERTENFSALKEALGREALQIEELGATRTLAYTDPLTGVKSKRAYLDIRKQLEQKIADNTIKEFALAVFDVNGLKEVNDNFGHDVGDQHIIQASSLICKILKHSPVFRIGGDEFVVFLEGEDYKNHESLLKTFDLQVEKNLEDGSVVISSGFADYHPNDDKSFLQVFERADKKMYERKHQLKNIPLGD